jgi:hypothetical protein
MSRRSCSVLNLLSLAEIKEIIKLNINNDYDIDGQSDDDVMALAHQMIEDDEADC